MTPATIGRRVGAYALDVAVVVGVLLVGAALGWALAAAIGSATVVIPTVAGLLGLAWLVVYTAMQGGRGSIGMRIVGTRLQRADGSGDLGFGKALLRNLVWELVISIIVGYFSPLFDSSGRRQGWHDQAVGAVMLDARAAASAAPDPEPAPARVAPDPILQAPTFDRLPPAPVGGFAPAEPSPSVSSRASAAPPVAAEGTMIAHVPGITPPAAFTARPPTALPVATPPAGTPAAATPPIAATATASDDLGETRVTRDPNAILLVWDDGTRHRVSGRTLFGRNPAPEEGAATVAVRDETLSLSKTHVEVDVSAEGAWIIDRHSTNGVTIVRAGRRIPCAPGKREPLHAGDALEIGDRVVTLGGLS